MPEKPQGGVTVIDGDMDLDVLIAGLDAARAPAPPAGAADTPPEPAAAAGDDLEMVELPEEPAELPPLEDAPPPPPAAGDDIEMVEVAEAEEPKGSLSYDAPAVDGTGGEVPMVEADGDVEMVEADGEAGEAAPPPAPLPDWLGDEVPSQPLVAREGLAVNLAAEDGPVELELRTEFERETPPDPEYTEVPKEPDPEDDDAPRTICGKCGTHNVRSLVLCRNCGDRLRHPDLD